MIVISHPDFYRDGFFYLYSMPLREANVNDVAELTELTKQLGYPLSEQEILTNLTIILNNDHEVIFVMTENEKVIAWIHIFHSIRLESGSFCELGGLVVDARYRSKGIGEVLVNKAIEWTRQRNVPLLKLRSNVIRKDAHRFYHRLGFKETKEQKVFEMLLNPES
jgi:GNAT superfamily N-acetyltransferase